MQFLFGETILPATFLGRVLIVAELIVQQVKFRGVAGDKGEG